MEIIRSKAKNKKNAKSNGLKASKGLIISFDAVISLSVMFILVVGATEAFNRIGGSSFDELERVDSSHDLLAALEKSGAFQRAVEMDDPAPLQNFFKDTPANLCHSLKVLDNNSVAQVYAVKDGCLNYGGEMQSSARTLVIREKSYMAVLNSWSKGT